MWSEISVKWCVYCTLSENAPQKHIFCLNSVRLLLQWLVYKWQWKEKQKVWKKGHHFYINCKKINDNMLHQFYNNQWSIINDIRLVFPISKQGGTDSFIHLTIHKWFMRVSKKRMVIIFTSIAKWTLKIHFHTSILQFTVRKRVLTLMRRNTFWQWGPQLAWLKT